MSVKLTNKLINVGSDVIMKPDVSLLLDSHLLKLSTKLFYPILIFTLFRSLNITDDASGKISTVDPPLLLLEHQELKAEKLFYYFSSELNHFAHIHSLWMLRKNTLYALIDRFLEVLQFRFELT